MPTKKFSFFDTEEIYKRAEEQDVYDEGDLPQNYDDTGFSNKWIQPPIACYFCCTEDKQGNGNIAPISMGTAVWGEPPNSNWYYTIAVQNSRQTNANLKVNKEVVISYIPSALLEESSIAALPIPFGINELDVANLTPLPSKKVKPSGIAECPVNLEAVVLESFPVSNTTIFIFKIVGVSVQEEFLKADMEHELMPGAFLTDILFEVSLTASENSVKMNYGKMDLNHIYRPLDTIGDKKRWRGSFETWMESEKERGRINQKEYNKLVELKDNWVKNRDPEKNAQTKNDLTSMLREIVWRKL